MVDFGVGLLLSDFDLIMLVFLSSFMSRSYPLLAGSPIDSSVKIQSAPNNSLHGTTWVTFTISSRQS